MACMKYGIAPHAITEGLFIFARETSRDPGAPATDHGSIKRTGMTNSRNKSKSEPDEWETLAPTHAQMTHRGGLSTFPRNFIDNELPGHLYYESMDSLLNSDYKAI